MSVNPLGELDLELDEVLRAEVSKRWAWYRSLTAIWVILLVFTLLVGGFTVVLLVADEPAGAGIALFVVLVMAWVGVSALGQRARDRWCRSLRLLVR